MKRLVSKKYYKKMKSTFSKVLREFGNEQEILATIPKNYEICKISEVEASDLDEFIPVEEI